MNECMHMKLIINVWYSTDALEATLDVCLTFTMPRFLGTVAIDNSSRDQMAGVVYSNNAEKRLLTLLGLLCNLWHAL